MANKFQGDTKDLHYEEENDFIHCVGEVPTREMANKSQGDTKDLHYDFKNLMMGLTKKVELMKQQQELENQELRQEISYVCEVTIGSFKNKISLKLTLDSPGCTPSPLSIATSIIHAASQVSRISAASNTQALDQRISPSPPRTSQAQEVTKQIPHLKSHQKVMLLLPLPYSHLEK